MDHQNLKKNIIMPYNIDAMKHHLCKQETRKYSFQNHLQDSRAYIITKYYLL